MHLQFRVTVQSLTPSISAHDLGQSCTVCWILSDLFPLPIFETIAGPVQVPTVNRKRQEAVQQQHVSERHGAKLTTGLLGSARIVAWIHARQTRALNNAQINRHQRRLIDQLSSRNSVKVISGYSVKRNSALLCPNPRSQPRSRLIHPICTRCVLTSRKPWKSKELGLSKREIPFVFPYR